MNIFYVDFSPKLSAQSLCDKHIVKMSLESAQMLANCFDKEVLEDPNTPKTQKGTPRRYSHWNHPSSIWTRATKGNMNWLIEHGIFICLEKKNRYPDKPLPFVYDFLVWCKENIELSTTPDGDFTPPPQCMPDHCKVEGNTVQAYREYYMKEKSEIVTWKCGNTPYWFIRNRC